MKNLMKLFLSLTVVLFVFACSKETTTSDASYENIVLDTRSTDTFCFEFVWPVTVSYKDGTTVEVNSNTELKAAVRGNRRNRGEIVYPINVVLASGEVSTIVDRAGFKTLLEGCGFTHEPHNHQDTTHTGGGHHGTHPHGGGFHFLNGVRNCFTVTYPVTILFEDGTKAVVATKEEAKIAIKTYKENGGVGSPSLMFPISVTLKDGTVQEVLDQAALIALIKSC